MPCISLRGLYRASSTVIFTAAGKYSLAVAGITVTTGTTAFEVVPNVDTRVTVEGLRDTITAGEMLPAFTVRYFDASGNPTDNGVGRVMYSRSGGSSTATIVMVRSAEGVYAVSATRATIAGNYLINVQGIQAANVVGNKDFVVMPTIATKASFIASTSAMNAAGAVLSLTASFFDIYNNPTDRIYDVSVRNDEFHFTDTVGLTRSRQGVYTARKTLKFPGDYVLRIDSLAGELNPEPPPEEFEILNDRFSLEPGPANRAVFTNVPASVIAGNALPRFTVSLFDRRNAPTDYTATGETQVNVTPPTTAQNQPSFLLGTFEPEDNQNGTYNVMRVDMAVTEPTKRFTGVGRYTLTVPGCTRYQGNRVFAVQAPPQATSVTFENVRSGLSVYEPQNAIRAIFRDASGNLTDNINVTPLAVTLRLPDNSTTSLALQQVSQGMYAITQPTTGYDQSGLYSLRVGTLAVLDQGFFSVAAPEFLGSLARINIVGRGYGGPSTLSDTPGYNTFLDNDGLDFDTVRVGTRSLAQNWEMVYRGMNRLRISALPQGFEVSSDNGATWITAVGGILQLPSTQGSINLPSLTPTRLTFTLNAGVKAPILIRFNPTTASAGETVGNFNLQAGSLTTPNEYRPLVRVRATRTARRLTAQRGQALFPNLKIDFADVTPNNGATLTESFTLQYDGMTSVRITAPQNYLISTADCPTPQQQCTLTGNASASMQITVHFPVPTNAGTYFGVVSILGTGIDGGQTRITIPVNCYAFQCGTIAGQREFVNIPKIKTLVIYTRGSAEQILAESNGTSCLPNAIYFKGLDVYDYVDKSIYATNRVYHNSGVGLRVTTDPVQVGTNGNDFTLRTPLIVPNDTIVSFMVNGNTVSGQLLPNVQDTMPWQTFYGTFYSNFANILNNPNSLLSLYRQSVGADIVVLIARASADSPFGGIARSKYGGAQNHYFFVEPASFIDSYIWAHEQGHVLGSDHSRYWRANPLVPSSGDNDCGALIDTENPRGRMWPTGSIMYPGLQRTPYAGNPDIYHETPETGVINPTFVPALPGYSNANEAELQGDADSRAMANLYRDDIDVQIVGNYEMNPGSSQTFTVNICGGTAPYVYQWYTLPLRQRVRPTAAGTNASLNFTMPSTAPYMLIRVVVRDAAGMKVTTEKVVTCSGCQPQTFATLGEKGATTLQNSEQLPPELPTMMQSDGRMCAMPNATGTIAFSSPDLTKESAQSNISSNIGNQSPSTLRFNQDEERPLQLNLEQNYPNPAQDETSIVFHLPKEEILKLSIYDALGKEVVLITEGRYKPGSYKFTVLLKNLSSGVYTYRLQTTKQNFIKRLVIVR